MKTKIIFSVMALAMMASAFGQKTAVELTFTAIDSGAYARLDSIKVMNRTLGGDTVIYWPDTTLSLETTSNLLLFVGYTSSFPVGLQVLNTEKEQFKLFQNYPNPVKDQSLISMSLPEKGTVHVTITDVQGRALYNSAWQLEKGCHSFRFKPGDGNLFFLTAWWKGEIRSIKILCSEPEKGMRCLLEYSGNNNKEISLKTTVMKSDVLIEESGILDKPQTDKTYTFQFATNIPCPGTPTVEYEGQVYNTIQVFSQCWLKENLNVGTMINGYLGQNQTNNSIKEKYCYGDNPDSCTKYGGLYQWAEMMQYNYGDPQGICPAGWHIPSDEEWKVLEGAVDSHYGFGDAEWDSLRRYRGFDAGMNLKTTSGWTTGGNGTDLFGFSGLPGGKYDWWNFYDVGNYGTWRASTKVLGDGAFFRELKYNEQEIYRTYDYYSMDYGFSVRCLRDE
jgi:uncharacterized protein (TIGR02145 family)